LVNQEIKSTVELVEEKLSSIGEITTKKMFGGFAFFMQAKCLP